MQWPCKPIDLEEADEPLPLDITMPPQPKKIMVIEVSSGGIKAEERSALPPLKPCTSDACTQTDHDLPAPIPGQIAAGTLPEAYTHGILNVSHFSIFHA